MIFGPGVLCVVLESACNWLTPSSLVPSLRSATDAKTLRFSCEPGRIVKGDGPLLRWLAIILSTSVSLHVFLLPEVWPRVFGLSGWSSRNWWNVVGRVLSGHADLTLHLALFLPIALFVYRITKCLIRDWPRSFVHWLGLRFVGLSLAALLVEPALLWTKYDCGIAEAFRESLNGYLAAMMLVAAGWVFERSNVRVIREERIVMTNIPNTERRAQMTIEEAAKALESIKKQRAELEQIVQRADHDNDAVSGIERLRRWKERTVKVLKEQVDVSEGERFDSEQELVFTVGAPPWNLEDEAEMYSAFLQALAEELRDHPGSFRSPATTVRPPKSDPGADTVSSVVRSGSRSPFIIHGHDELNVRRLTELLEKRWKLTPVVLAAKPPKGRTLIEKFEEEAKDSAFAIALLTPDDTIMTSTGEYAQARPNVTFELGWFYGRLGRRKVCILFKKETKLHSDLEGINRIEFSEDVTEKVLQLEDELRGAGVIR